MQLALVSIVARYSSSKPNPGSIFCLLSRGAEVDGLIERSCCKPLDFLRRILVAGGVLNKIAISKMLGLYKRYFAFLRPAGIAVY